MFYDGFSTVSRPRIYVNSDAMMISPQLKMRVFWFLGALFGVVAMSAYLHFDRLESLVFSTRTESDDKTKKLAADGEASSKDNVIADVPFEVRGPKQVEQEGEPSVWGGVSSMVMGLHALADIEAHFEKHIDKALNGDPMSMLEISHVMQNCMGVSGLSPNNYESEIALYVEQGQLPESMASEMRLLAGPCFSALKRFPHKPSFEASGIHPIEGWTVLMRERAAQEGNVLAKIERAIYLPTEDSSHENVSTWLEDAVRTGDYRAAYLASSFYANFHDPLGEDFNRLESLKWEYAGCLQHDLCDERSYLQRLISDLTPSEIGIVQEFGSTYKDRLDDDEPFRFSEAWMKEDQNAFFQEDNAEITLRAD